MALPVSFAGEKIADNTKKSNQQPETTSWSVPVTTLTAANMDAQVILVGNLYAAIGSMILGNVLQSTLVLDRSELNVGPAATIAAQRENKMLLRYHDATSNVKFQVSVGTFDLTKLTANTEYVALGSGVGAALKTAFEAVVVSPDDSSHATVLDSVQFVGRNS